MSTLPHCPLCESTYTYEDRNLYVCPECAHEWSQDEVIDTADTAALVTDAIRQLKERVAKALKGFEGQGLTVEVKVGTRVKNIRLFER